MSDIINEGIVNHQVIVQELNGNLVINGSTLQRHNEAVLFLRIESKKDDKQERTLQPTYTAKMEMKVGDEYDQITESISFKLENGFSRQIDRFNHLMRTGGERVVDPAALFEQEFINLDVELGRQLYYAFFRNEIRDKFGQVFELLGKGKFEKLTLIISSPDPLILNLPFELITGESESKPFVLQKDSFILARSQENSLGQFEISGIEPSNPPLKMLYVSSLPVTLPEDARLIELEKEQELFINATADLIQVDNLLVEFLDLATIEEIKRALAEGHHHIIHFSAHGAHHLDGNENEAGVLYLENEQGETENISGEKLAEIVSPYSSVKLVVLSACESGHAEQLGVAGALVNAGIPGIIGMHYPVGDTAATTFTTNFYASLCKGDRLSEAMFNGRKKLYEFIQELKADENNTQSVREEWVTPFLYLNQNMNRIVDYSKPREQNEYFHRKPSTITVGGLKLGKGFVGRHREIIGLYRLFRNDNHSIAIYGQGGTGKTTLAIRFADNYERGQYRIIQFMGKVNEDMILTRIAGNALESIRPQLEQAVRMPDISPTDKLDLLIENMLHEGKYIVLFDNFEDNQAENREKAASHSEISSDSLRDFLTYFCKKLNKASYILFTTRYKFKVPMIADLNLGEMRFSDAFKLANRYEHTLKKLSLEQKKTVHRRLGGHPRAFETLDGLLKESRFSPEQGWHMEEEKMGEVVDWEINHDLLLNMLWDKLSDDEQKVMKQMAVFRELIPFHGAAQVTGLNKGTLLKILSRLNELSFLYVADDRYYCHRITALFVSRENTDETELKDLHRLAGEYFESIRTEKGLKFAENDIKARWHYLMAEKWDKAADITFVVITHLSNAGYTQLSYVLLNELLDKKISDEYRAGGLFELGILESLFGKYDKAQECYEQALYMFQSKADIRNVGNVTHRLGILHQHKGEYASALELFKKSIELNKKTGNLKGVTGNLFHMGIIYQKREEYDKALEFYEKSLEIDNNIGDEYGMSNSWHQIGIIHQHKGHYDQALEFFEKSMQTKNKYKDVNGVAEDLHGLAIIYQKRGEYDKALRFLVNAKEVFKKTGNLLAFASSISQMGKIHRLKGDYDQALACYLTAYELFNRLGSPYKENVMKGIQLVKERMDKHKFNQLLKKTNIKSVIFPEPEKCPPPHTHQQSILVLLSA